MKAQPWTLKMVCLSQTTDNRILTTVAARETLVQAGLGEKKFPYLILILQVKNSVT